MAKFKSLLPVMMVVLGLLLASPFAMAVPPPQLATVVKNNWESWGKGQPVSLLDLVHQLARPDHSEVQAAALAQTAQRLHNYYKHNKWSYSRTIDLQEVLPLVSTQPVQTAFAKKLDSIGSINKSLYAKGGIVFEDLQQGPDGDCYFFSAVGWLATYRPEAITSMIQETGNGSYRVSFADGSTVEVGYPTVAEMLFFNSAASNQTGIWLPVLEKAFGKASEKYVPGKSDDLEPMWNIDNGGKMEVAQRILTGYPPRVYWLNNPPKGGKVRLAPRGAVRHALIEMKNQRLMAQAGVPAEPAVPVAKPPAFTTHHAYTVLDFDPRTDTVTLWNPWGTSFTPSGPDSPANGYARKNGIFKMSFEDFTTIYQRLVIQHH